MSLSIQFTISIEWWDIPINVFPYLTILSPVFTFSFCLSFSAIIFFMFCSLICCSSFSAFSLSFSDTFTSITVLSLTNPKGGG